MPLRWRPVAPPPNPAPGGQPRLGLFSPQVPVGPHRTPSRRSRRHTHVQVARRLAAVEAALGSEDLASARTALDRLSEAAPDNPQLGPLRYRLEEVAERLARRERLSAIAASVCSCMRPVRLSGAAASRPAVSMTPNARSPSRARPSRRSRVTPGRSSTNARRLPTRRLNSVDLPTFGRPTMATVKLMSGAALRMPLYARRQRRTQISEASSRADPARRRRPRTA